MSPSDQTEDDLWTRKQAEELCYVADRIYHQLMDELRALKPERRDGAFQIVLALLARARMHARARAQREA